MPYNVLEQIDDNGNTVDILIGRFANFDEAKAEASRLNMAEGRRTVVMQGQQWLWLCKEIGMQRINQRQIADGLMEEIDGKLVATDKLHHWAKETETDRLVEAGWVVRDGDSVILTDRGLNEAIQVMGTSGGRNPW
jgi:hypothetical protein